MPKCYLCLEEVSQLFKCEECGKSYCSLHRDPSDHNCEIFKEESLHQPYQAAQPLIENDIQILQEAQFYVQGQDKEGNQSLGVIRGTTDGTYTWYRQERSIPENAFSPGSGINFKGILFPYKSEFIHLLVGCGLIYLLGLLAFYNIQLINSGYGWAIFVLAGFYTTAFLFHELGHRQVARHYKFQTKFRLLTLGMGLTIISLTIGIIFLNSEFPAPTFALPGAVVVLGLDKISRETGRCKAAGPTVNLIYGIILLIVSVFLPFYPLNFFIASAASINFMLGAFNMIPLGILDGQNILKWNKRVYLVLFTSLIGLLILNYLIIYVPNLRVLIWPPQ